MLKKYSCLIDLMSLIVASFGHCLLIAEAGRLRNSCQVTELAPLYFSNVT